MLTSMATPERYRWGPHRALELREGLGDFREGRKPAFGHGATSRCQVPSPWQCSA